MRTVFSGGVRDWSQVSGASVAGTIDLYTRNSASGTHDAFQKIIMGSTNVASFASQFSSNGLVEQRVQSDPRGIGYVSLHFGGGVHPVSYEGVACNLRNAKWGSYPAVRNLYMVTRGNAKGAVGRFISWVRNSGAASKIVASGWVPLK